LYDPNHLTLKQALIWYPKLHLFWYCTLVLFWYQHVLIWYSGCDCVYSGTKQLPTGFRYQHSGTGFSPRFLGPMTMNIKIWGHGFCPEWCFHSESWARIPISHTYGPPSQGERSILNLCQFSRNSRIMPRFVGNTFP
jgi:hypothetical protein